MIRGGREAGFEELQPYVIQKREFGQKDEDDECKC